MGVLEEGFRHFWLRDIHHVSGVTREGLGQWITRKEFIVSQARGRDDFSIQILAPETARRGVAHDSTRMASAAFETIFGIDAVRGLPKSAGWIVVRAYYAAFFAAHSLLRMFGTNCMQLDQPQIKALDDNATLFGCLPPNGFEGGFYVGRFDPATAEIHFRKSAAARRGSHEILWETFANKVREVSNHLLTVSSKYTSLAVQLSEIENLLKQGNLSSGTWLSHIRNLANYRHDFGLWFPYSGSQVSAIDLVRTARKWTEDPVRLFPVPKTDQVSLHVWLSTCIVAMCRAVVSDMEAHSLRRKSFHSYGSMALARMAG